MAAGRLTAARAEHVGHEARRWWPAAALLLVVALWAPLELLFSAGDLPARLWMGPLDRLLLTVALVGVGWVLCRPAQDARGRAVLAAGLSLSVLAYAGWAPVWAREVARNPAALADPKGVAGTWDAVRAALAVGALVLARRRGVSARSLALVAALGAGSALDLVLPGGTGFAAWSRLGALAGAAVLAMATATDASALDVDLLQLNRARPARLLRLLASVRPAARRDGPAGENAGSHDPARDAAVDLALRTAADRLAARPVFVALLTARGDLELRGLASPATQAMALGTVAILNHPTIQRALGREQLELQSSHLQADLDELFSRVSKLPVGPALLARIGTDRPYGVLVAGRRRGAWDAGQAADLAAIARQVGAALDALDDRQRVAGETARAMGALEAQGAAITRLDRSVESLERRVGTVEAHLAQFAAAPEELARPGHASPADARPAEAAMAAGWPTAAPVTLGAQLLPAMADALKAPISSILGYSDLLTRGDGLAPDHMGRFLERIDANLARMQVMLGNLATIGELDGAAPARPEAVDPVLAVRHAVDRAQPQLREKGLCLECHTAEGLPGAWAEPEAVERMLDNLLANAVARSPQGGDLAVGVRAAGQSGERYVVFSVHDRGRAAAGAPGTLFDLDDDGASGVALRLVRLLADRQGGCAWMEDDAGGASFNVRLPASEAASEAATPPGVSCP